MSTGEMKNAAVTPDNRASFLGFSPLMQLIVLSKNLLSDTMLDTVFRTLKNMMANLKVLPSNKREDKKTKTAGQDDGDAQGHCGSSVEGHPFRLQDSSWHPGETCEQKLGGLIKSG